MKNILTKIKEAGLVGRGGASFPVAAKWEAVYQAAKNSKKMECEADNRQEVVCRLSSEPISRPGSCYVVANGAEGEPGVLKDGYILKNHPDRVIDGLRLAVNYLGAQKAYLYLNHDYYKESGKRLLQEAKKAKFSNKLIIFLKPFDSGYIGGEESAVLNIIEGHRAEPRLRPPYPTSAGLFNQPTLINNVETFYNISLVASGEYQNNRFYTLGGQAKNKGVFILSDKMSVKEVLIITHNYPKFPFFVQIGGEASGEVLNSKQLNRPVSGAGSITLYDLNKHNPRKLFSHWLDFYLDSSCGQCTTCREGVYRLKEICQKKKISAVDFYSLVENLNNSSFCALGSSLPVPLLSYLKNIKKFI